MTKSKIKQAFEWVYVVVIGFLVANLLCFAYERQPGWLDTPNGASASVWEPNAIIIHGKEGFSISRVDDNGYMNPQKRLAEKYVLMMGSSHTQGKEIAPEKKYSMLVNEYLADDDLLHTYNIACDGSNLTTHIKYFKAAMEAFPKAEVVTIEISSSDFSAEKIRESLIQPEYNSEDSAIRFGTLSFKERTTVAIKDYVPMVTRIKEIISTSKKSNKTSDLQIDLNEYSVAIDEALSTIRSETNARIVFLYHPTMNLQHDGSVSLNYGETWDIFKASCEKNGIDVIDSGSDFYEYYYRKRELPYGFMNTSLGTGHLNDIGHKIIADEIIEYLEELK